MAQFYNGPMLQFHNDNVHAESFQVTREARSGVGLQEDLQTGQLAALFNLMHCLRTPARTGSASSVSDLLNLPVDGTCTRVALV